MRLRRKQPEIEPGRRRTQVGRQAPPAAFSYYTQRSERSTNTGRGQIPEESGSKNGLLQLLLQRFGLIVLLLAIAAALISSLSLSVTPRIVPVGSTDSRVFLHSTLVYQQAAQSILAGSIWNHTKLTINTAAFQQKMRERFPELTDVSVALPFLGHRPLIYVQPSRPALIVSNASGAFVVDEHGKALLLTTHLPADIKLELPLITDQSKVNVHEGQQILTANDVAFIQAIAQQLAAHSLVVSSFTLPQTASELDVRLSGQPFFVKFNMHASPEDARQQAGTFIAVLGKLQSQNITPSQYIDARVDGRAYYQ